MLTATLAYAFKDSDPNRPPQPTRSGGLSRCCILCVFRIRSMVNFTADNEWA